MTTDHDPDNDHIKLLQIKTWETFTQYNIRAWILDTYAKNGGKPFSRVKMLEVYDSQADKLHPHWAPPEAGKPVATDAFKQYKLRRVKDRIREYPKIRAVWAEVKRLYPNVDLWKDKAALELSQVNHKLETLDLRSKSERRNERRKINPDRIAKRAADQLNKAFQKLSLEGANVSGSSAPRRNRRPLKQTPVRLAKKAAHELNKALKKLSIEEIMENPQANVLLPHNNDRV